MLQLTQVAQKLRSIAKEVVYVLARHSSLFLQLLPVTAAAMV